MSRSLAAPVAMLHGCRPLRAQSLAPRAYLITPTSPQARILPPSFHSGTVLADPSVPIQDAKGSVQVPLLGYYHSVQWLARSSNITLIAPYARGNFSGTVNGSVTEAYRSGLADA